MTTRKFRFAIFGNIYQPKKSVSIQKILACLSQHEAEIFIERNFYTFITEGQQLPLSGVHVFDDSQFEADFAISMGGDGTFLRTASVVGSKQIPILGINTGRLGFLADVNAQEGELSSVFSRLMAISEAYPNLKADGMFLKTMDSIRGYEENVRMSRMVYNYSATKMNRAVRQWPSSFVASMLHFGEREYLTVDDQQKKSMPDLFPNT